VDAFYAFLMGFTTGLMSIVAIGLADIDCRYLAVSFVCIVVTVVMWGLAIWVGA